MNRPKRIVAFTLLLSLVLVAGALAAVPGELDPTFGGGRVTTSFGGETSGRAVALQPDGKIVVAGYGGEPLGIAIARFLPSGGLDPGFGGGDGKVATPLGALSFASDVAIQGDGKILAVGATGGDFAFVRYLESGTPDPAFGGGDGVVTLPVGTLADTARAVSIGPGGKIAATGESAIPGSGFGAGVAILKEDGTPENAFSGDGVTVISTDSDEDDRGSGIVMLADGGVVLADQTGSGGGDGFTIVRLTAAGVPDAGFGGDGVVETPILVEGGEIGGRSTDLLVQPDGRIVAGGYGFGSSGSPPTSVATFAAARYTVAGDLDPSFGIGGIQSVPMVPGRDALASSIARADDGKLVLAGTYDPDPRPTFEAQAPALVRFDENGSLDTTFGAGGKVIRPLPSGIEDESLDAAAIQPDGALVTTGRESPSSGPSSMVVSRFVGRPDATVLGRDGNSQPDTNMKRVPRRLLAADLGGFRGTAKDPDGDGLRKVQVAVSRLSPPPDVPRASKARCLFLSRKGRFKGSGSTKGRCEKRWLDARGKAKWKITLRRDLPAGRYVVYSRAVDGTGLAESGFKRSDRNRYAFVVR